jgi:hypothetical protein
MRGRPPRARRPLDVPEGDEPIRHTFAPRRGVDLRVHEVGKPPARFDFEPRVAEGRLDLLLKEFPAVLVVGPRQCGKSTLVRASRPRWTHLDLERPADLALLNADIEGFLDAHPRDLAIDEAQRLPAVFPALRRGFVVYTGKERRAVA